jgi:hypothetical protein
MAIFSVKSIVSFYLATCILAISSGESEISQLTFCAQNKFNTEHK